MIAGLDSVLIEVEKRHEDVVKLGNLELYKDTGFNPTENIRIYGVVVALPLNDRVKDIYGVEIVQNIQIGDKVYFRYINQDNDGLRIEERGKFDVIRVHYADVFCVVREGKIIPCSGWCFGEPLLEENGIKLFFEQKTKIITSITRKKKLNKTKVLIVGTETLVGEETEIKPGDEVIGFVNFENEIEGKTYCLFKEELLYGKVEL